MIAAHFPFSALVARLTDKADTLASAHAQSAALKGRGDSRHWRNARLVWPLFGER